MGNFRAVIGLILPKAHEQVRSRLLVLPVGEYTQMVVLFDDLIQKLVTLFKLALILSHDIDLIILKIGNQLLKAMDDSVNGHKSV